MATTTKKTGLILSLIIILSFFLRFYRFSHRWVLNQDQARDTVMIMYALKNKTLPLLGSPASAGPFNFGPYYHWLIGFFKNTIPGISGPWIGFTAFSAIMPFLFYFIGKNTINKSFALLVALLSAITIGQVAHAPDMLNTVLTSYLVTISFFCLSRHIKNSNCITLFLFSYFTSLATVSHFQSLGIFSLTFLVLLSELLRKQSIKEKIIKVTIIAFSTLLTYLPLIIFDINNQGLWIKSVINYYVSGQNKFYYPVRWLTDIFVFWPQLWGQVISGNVLVGYGLSALFIFSLIINLKNIKKHKFILFLTASFLLQVILIRYYKGVRSPEYFFTFHPYFIFFTGWTLWQIRQKQKTFAIIISFGLLLIISKNNLKLIINDQSQAHIIQQIKKDIEIKTGQGSFSFYTLHGDNMVNLPLVYLFYHQGQIRDGGYKIGTCQSKTNQSCPDSGLIVSKHQNYTIYDLNEHKIEEYDHFSPQKIYNWLYVNY